MVPPKAKGRVKKLAPAGEYNIDKEILTLEYDGKETHYTMCHWWPVRQSRPVAEKLSGDTPLLTG